MTFVSYAQNFEDVLLWRALNDVGEGKYLDIGAQDPVVNSVSYAFYLAGWRGIHVEPTPAYATKLRASRPDEIVIQAAATDMPGPIEFYEIDETGLSTGRADIADHHSKSGFQPHRIFTPTVSLDALLAMIGGDVHWMNMDVEGMEYDVLRSWGNSPVRPWILAIESTFPNSRLMTHEVWLEEVLQREYREVFFDGLSRYFVHHSQAQRESAFSTPANVFDGFAVTQHHFSASCLSGKLEAATAEAESLRILEAEVHSQLGEIRVQLEAANVEIESARARSAALGKQLSAAEESRDQSRTQLAQVEASLGARQRDLERALDQSKAAEIGAQIELAKVKERAKALEEELAKAREDRDRSHREAAEDRARLEREQSVMVDNLWRERQAAEADLHQAVRVAIEGERAARLELAGTAQSLRDAQEVRERQRRLLEAAAAEDAALREELARLSERLNSLVQELLRERQEQQKSRLEMEIELQRLRAALSRASSGSWVRIGKLLGLTRTPPALDALAQWPATTAETLGGGDGNIESRSDENRSDTKAHMSSENPYLRANSLAELLAWEGLDFVRCAYVTVLGRQPDPMGEVYYIDRLRRGHSKMEILWQLRRSQEGRRHDPGIAGFDAELRRAKRARMSVVGIFFPDSSLEPQRNKDRSSDKPSIMSGDTLTPTTPFAISDSARVRRPTP